MKTAHILWIPHSSFDYAEWWDAFVDQRVDPYPFAIQSSEKPEVLFLPSFEGLCTTGVGFQGRLSTISPHYTPPLPLFEHFRLYHLQQLLDTEIPIVAIGHSACTIWEMLGGKLMIEKGVATIDMNNSPKKTDLVKESLWEFRTDAVLGLSEFDPWNEDDMRKVFRFLKGVLPPKSGEKELELVD